MMECSAAIFPPLVGILGSTGSVGTQAVDVVRAAGIEVDFLTANENVLLAEEQIRALSPRVMVMASERAASDLRVRVSDTATRVLSSADAIAEVIEESAAPRIIHSILGEAGLAPLRTCIACGKTVGLANKESLVIAGDILLCEAQKTGARIIPVDSEHSAIFQCLGDSPRREVRSILLTASGGPFYGYSKEKLRTVTKAQTLAHPTWKMGAKITVDSASLMNKGFEVIEAVRLFGVSPEQIQVVVHRESIIHSAVEYIDSAVIAQMGVPDMRLCVQYALTYPNRVQGLVKPLSLTEVGKLTFGKPDMETFPLLSEAFRAIALGGAVPAVLNAANEVAVSAFLEEKISFCDIADVVKGTLRTLDGADSCACNTVEDRINYDRKARKKAAELISLQRKAWS